MIKPRELCLYEKIHSIMVKDEQVKRYLDYQAADFAGDAFFLEGCYGQDEESVRFWAQFKAEYPEKEKEIRRAVAIVKSIRLNDCRFSEEEKNRAIGKLTAYIRMRKRNSRLRMYASVAAVALLAFFAVSVSYLAPSWETSEENVAQTFVVPYDEEIRLIADDNRSMAISNQSQIICDPQGNIAVEGERRDSLVASPVESEITYRTLIVPNGKRTSLLLADGTKVWVNSGTTLEFPVAFNNQRREIKVNGEVYLEVAPNKELPFVVSTNQFDVQVLGTKFGISAYSQLAEQNVVLVEGSVQVNTQTGYSTRLKPSELLSVSNGQTAISIVDPYTYISWIEDVLYFKGETLQEVFLRLGKQYAVDIVCNQSVRKTRLYGKLVLQEHIEDVLDNLSVLSPIEYTVENNMIIVDKK